MPWNLLIFPLAAGYYILTRFYVFKYRQQRLDRQRLIFESILLGTIIACFLFSFRLLFEYLFPETLTVVSDAFPFKQKFTITSLLSLPLALGFTKIGNCFLDGKEWIIKAIVRVGNEMELLLENSFSNKELLQFTMDNNKVYVGWVKELPIPSLSSHVRIIPALSGYRTLEKQVVFNCQYLKVYSEYIKKGKIKNPEDLQTDLVLNVNNVVTVSFFDFELYEAFNTSD